MHCSSPTLARLGATASCLRQQNSLKASLVRRRVVVLAKPGFGAKGRGSRQADKLPTTNDLLLLNQGWRVVAYAGELQDVAEGGNGKAVELKDRGGFVVCVLIFEGKCYCIENTSTAFKFPIMDGKVERKGTQITIEVPLDGTTYDLETGEVVEWCPPNTFIRKTMWSKLGKPKARLALKTYPAQLSLDGAVLIQMT